MQRVCAKSSEEEICWENYEWFSVENFVGWWEWQDIKWWNGRTFLAVQWLTLWVSTAGNVGSIPGQGTKIPQGERCGQKRRKKIERKWKWTYLKKNWIGLPRWLSGKECLPNKRLKFPPWVGKILQSRKQLSTPVFLPGKSHRQRNLAGYSS